MFPGPNDLTLELQIGYDLWKARQLERLQKFKTNDHGSVSAEQALIATALVALAITVTAVIITKATEQVDKIPSYNPETVQDTESTVQNTESTVQDTGGQGNILNQIGG